MIAIHLFFFGYTVFKLALKFIFASLIVAWLISKGQLDFSLLSKSLDFPGRWLILSGFLLANTFLLSLRWKMLLEIKSKNPLSLLDVTKLTWIGLFFCTVLPGVITGDVIKMVYTKDLDKSYSKTFILTSILMDRFLGLLGLLFLLGFFSIIYYSELITISTNVERLLHVNFLIFFGMFVLLGVLFLPQNVRAPFTKYSSKVPLVGKKVAQAFEQLWLIGADKKVIFKCATLSILTQAGNVLAFWAIASPFFETPLAFQHAFTFFPIGFVAVALPISPSGIGVGHAAFSTLFSYFSITNGASLFNLYLVALIGLNLIGAIPYIFRRKRSREIVST